MHHSNNPVKHHIEATVFNQISKVLEKWLVANPEATPEEIARIEAEVTLNITESAKKPKFMNSKVIRKLRKDYVNQTAAGLGLSFYHLDAARKNKAIPEEIQKIVSAIAGITGKNFGISETVQVTVAARLAVLDGNKFGLEMAFAVKNPNDEDEYDELVGKEYSLEYFLAGKIKARPLYLDRFMETIPADVLGEMVDEYVDLNK